MIISSKTLTMGLAGIALTSVVNALSLRQKSSLKKINTWLDCCKILHKLYQHIPTPEMGLDSVFLEMLTVDFPDSWLCSSQKVGMSRPNQVRPHTPIIQSSPSV